MSLTPRNTPFLYVLDEEMRILVVDDDPILREFARVYLATPSATIETACDGRAAIEMLACARYDVVVSDIDMPNLDGFGLLEWIRADERLRDVPVIMLTSHEDIASMDRAHALGASSFANKPVNWRLVSYLIRQVWRTRRLQEEVAGLRAQLAQAERVTAL